MAIITCPECGQQVSNKAKKCVHCGTPLTIDNKIKVKIPRFCTGMLNQKACEVEVQIDGKTVWNGFSGSVAVFETEQECNVSFLIKKAYTGHPFPFFKDFSIDGTLQPGKRYEIKNAVASLVFGDPTKSTFVFSDVDVIDSGL